jgi:hypothetical protein
MKTGPRNISIQIRELLKIGIEPIKISELLSCRLSTITYHAKKLEMNIVPRPTYEWSKIKDYYDQGHSISDCVKRFGCSTGAWWKAAKAGRVIPRLNPDGTPERECMSLEILLTPGRKQTSRGHVKSRLLKAGLLEKKCFICGIVEWRHKPLSFNLDHADGDKFNWSLGNLRMVCPNCDSQQETFSGRNIKRLREQRETESLPGHLIGRMQSSEDCHVGSYPTQATNFNRELG